MDEVDPETAGATTPTGAVPLSAGETLRAAREAQGLSIADVGTRTRIPARHLDAIERSDYTGLPSATYAVGFAKGYARAVGLDEVAIAQAVRLDVDRLGRRVPEYEPHDVADPARVPSRGVAIVGVGIALALLVLVGLWYGTDWFRGAGVVRDVPPAVVGAPATVPVASPTRAPAIVAAQGQVTLVAGDEVWMRVYDADNKTLYLGTMKPGERFDVPQDAKGPMINVGRPDKLAVTVNGSAVPPLGTGERAIKEVGISAAALAARAAGSPAPTPSATPTSASRRTENGPSTDSRPRRERRVLSETQRANLDAAANPPPVSGNSSPQP